LPVRAAGTIPVVGERNCALAPGHRPWEGGRPPKETAMVSLIGQILVAIGEVLILVGTHRD
jgi:hypothetical protein